MSKGKRLKWRVNFPQLIKEISHNNGVSILAKPLQITMLIMSEIGERAVELNDPKLNLLMLRMAIYEQGDPYSKAYVPEAFDKMQEMADNHVERFPNGFDDWHETHYQMVSAIEREMSKTEPTGRVNDVHLAEGHGGLFTLAKELTDEFEQQYIRQDWIDKEWWDTIDEFIKKKLYET